MSLLNVPAFYSLLFLFLSLSLSPPMSSFLPDFIRPPSTSTAPAPLPLFTAEQYTILSFRRDISRVNTRSCLLAKCAASHRIEGGFVYIRVYCSSRVRAHSRVVSSDRERVYIARAMGSALIRKLYEYRITCYPFRMMNFLLENALMSPSQH